MGTMGRTLGGDFEDDDFEGGTLDLGSGSIASHHPGSASSGGSGGAAASAYDGGGVDFDDPFADETPAGALELDLPMNSATALRSKAPTAPAPPLPAGAQVPELALGPPPAPRSSGMIDAAPMPSSSSSSPGRLGPVPSAPPSSQRFTSGQVPAPSSSSPMMSGPPSSQQQPHTSGHAPASHGGSGYAPPASFAAPPSRPTAAAVIARYPVPPVEVWRTPRYALAVMYRQLELRTDLESLRRRRSPDVPLYEAALRAYDSRTFRVGMTINLAIFAVAMFVFFLPVIIRFTRTY